MADNCYVVEPPPSDNPPRTPFRRAVLSRSHCNLTGGPTALWNRFRLLFCPPPPPPPPPPLSSSSPPSDELVFFFSRTTFPPLAWRRENARVKNFSTTRVRLRSCVLITTVGLDRTSGWVVVVARSRESSLEHAIPIYRDTTRRSHV